MKRALIIVAVLIIIFWPVKASAEDNENSKVDDAYTEQASSIDTADIERFIEELNRETDGYIPPMNFKSFINIFKTGKINFSMKDMLSGLLKYLLNDILLNSKLMSKLVVITIICAILQNLENAFGNESVSNLAYYACYLLVIIIVIKSFSLAINIGKNTITKMTDFMIALLPSLLTLITSVGGVASATVFDPLIIGMIQVLSYVVRDVIIPIIFLTAILSIVNNLSDTFQISKLVDLLKQTCKWALGFTLTVVVGIITVRGAVSQTLDQVVVKTAKFAVDNFIPVIGKCLSDAVAAVASYSLILKDAISTAGLIALVLTCIFPLIKVVSLIFIYKLSGALIEPISDKRIVNCLNEVGNSLTMLFASVLSVAVMFFIMVTIMASTGKMAVMAQ